MKHNTLVLSLIASFLLIASIAFSQNTIQGTVTNSESGDALLGVTILVIGTQESGTTDSEGNFSIQSIASLPARLRISYFGFRTQEFEINSYDGIAIEMSALAYEGETVVVSASRKKEKISEATSSVSILESRKIEAKAYSHPALNLHQVPGVNVSVQGTDHFQITLRGRNEAFATETYFLQDYRSLVTPAQGLAILSRTPLVDIDINRIEVVQGPGSALYGPGVETGVIHFLSKSARDFPGSSFSLIGGTQSTVGASFRHASPLSDKTSYKFVGYYQRSNDFGLDPDDPDDAFSLSQFVPEIRSALTGETLFTDVTQPVQDNARYGLTASIEHEFNSNAQLIFNAGYSNRKGTVRASLGEAHQDHPDYFVQARYNSDDFFAQAYLNVLDNSNEKSYLNRTGFSSIAKNFSYNLQAQKRFDDLTDKLDLIVGAEAQLTRSQTEGTVHGRYEDQDDFDIYSIYAQSNYSLLDNLKFIVAARYDRFNALENNSLSPRAGLVYKHSPTQTFRASYNRAVSSPQSLFLFADLPFGASPAFDIPLIGGIEAIEFADNIVTESFIPGVGSYPGLDIPLSIPYAIATSALSSSFPQEVIDYLNGKIVEVSNSSAGLTLLNNQISTVLPERPQVKPSITNAYEIGYKGVFGSKFSLGLDLYYNKRKDLVFVSQTSPLVLYPTLAADLSAELLRVTDAQELLNLGIPQEAVIDAYAAVASGLAENPLGLIEPNLAADAALPQFVFSFYNAGSIDYYGADLSLGYYHSEDLFFYGNYSWLSKNYWNDEEIGQAGTGQAYSLNVADHRINVGFEYIPEKGLGFGASYRHQNGVQIENGTAFSGTLEAYGIADINVSYSFNEKLNLSCTVQNALGDEYRIMPYMPKIGRMALLKLVCNL